MKVLIVGDAQQMGPMMRALFQKQREIPLFGDRLVKAIVVVINRGLQALCGHRVTTIIGFRNLEGLVAMKELEDSTKDVKIDLAKFDIVFIDEHLQGPIQGPEVVARLSPFVSCVRMDISVPECANADNKQAAGAKIVVQKGVIYAALASRKLTPRKAKYALPSTIADLRYLEKNIRKPEFRGLRKAVEKVLLDTLLVATSKTAGHRA